jgi:Putative beta-lactamase-inhibitor-like, PepSY-like
MKKIILAVILIGAFTVSLFAFGNDTIPEAVKAKFALLYPGITKVKWEKEGTNYEGAFEMNKTEMSCLFDPAGDLLETENKIEIPALPKAAVDYITKNYAGQKIKEAAKIADSKKVITYEAEVKEGDLIFDEKGNFLKKVLEAKERGDERGEKK